MLWLKAFHIVAMVAWFAGLFYLPRLFVYHADAADGLSVQRFRIMERRLYAIMSIGAAATIVLGLSLIAVQPGYLAFGWLRAKISLVVLLVAYHAYCYRLVHRFANGINLHSARWYRVFNEVPSLLLIGIIVLAVVKP